VKKVIRGSVYNTETARKICEKFTEGPEHAKGAIVKKLQQLYRTKSAKYFIYVRREFETWVAVNNDDLDPIYEEQEVIEEKILPVSFDFAFQFASEIYADSETDSETKEAIVKFFPALSEEGIDENKKIQKKIYLSEKANRYLEMTLEESNDTISSFVEQLIVEEYKRLYSKGIMKNDPFFEMED
jgi:hypothetical protein